MTWRATLGFAISAPRTMLHFAEARRTIMLPGIAVAVAFGASASLARFVRHHDRPANLDPPTRRGGPLAREWFDRHTSRYLDHMPVAMNLYALRTRRGGWGLEGGEGFFCPRAVGEVPPKSIVGAPARISVTASCCNASQRGGDSLRRHRAPHPCLRRQYSRLCRFRHVRHARLPVFLSI